MFNDFVLYRIDFIKKIIYYFGYGYMQHRNKRDFKII